MSEVRQVYTTSGLYNSVFQLIGKPVYLFRVVVRVSKCGFMIYFD